MPYPILTLPYPFARRLCQLLNPEELENLQIAAGYNTRHLKPIIQLIKTQTAGINNENSNVTLYFTETRNNHKLTRSKTDEAPFLKVESLFLFKLTKSLFEKSCFTHLFIITEQLNFCGCEITVDFLKMIALRIPQIYDVTWLKFVCRCQIDKDVKLPFIFNTFPNVKVFEINYAYNGWLTDLLDLNVVNQRGFSLLHKNFDELFSFNADELYYFIQKQQTEFFIRLTYICDADADQDEIKKAVVTLLKPRFPTVVEPTVVLYPPLPGQIEVSFGVSGLSLKYLYFLP
uniref:F-box domain-containing protein n=1 Tax=Panagrellus redivivus TaxID=6233 RepID=A0A7E4WDR6_PANRE